MNTHHRQNPHLRLSVPPPLPPISRLYPSFPTPTPSSASTPSKRRLSSTTTTSSSSSTSFSSLFLLLFSLRSLYSLLPFLRSSPPSFSLFPFSFLVSLVSFLLSLFSFSLFPSSPSPDPHLPLLHFLKTLTLTLTSQSHLRPLATKSTLLALVFLLRFQALRYCGTSATILADFSGSLVAISFSDYNGPYGGPNSIRRARKIRGFTALIVAMLLLSYSWDRIGCFPMSSSLPPATGCVRVLPMLLPFLSGFLGFYERASSNWGSLRQLGRKRVRLASLALTTVMLFIPAFISFVIADGDKGVVSVGSLGWPLVNTVIFGVILSENYSDDRVAVSAKDLRKDFLVTFFCTLVLELFYFPKLSLPGFLFCGILLWISVRELGSSSLNYLELGSNDPSESLYSMIMNPIRHILSERKSRKIALFLLINTAYMVVEFIAGFMSNSLGLISDACHMLFDCAALAIGLYASYISRLPANNQFNYGRGRFEVLSGYVNAVFLVLVGVLIVLESFERILDPQEISTNSLLTVSIGGLLVNVVGLVFFHEEHHHAHGGASACSHSHSHSNSHSHSHSHSQSESQSQSQSYSPSHHHHQHHAHDHAGHDQEHNAGHHECCVVTHESSDGHSHGGNDHNCSTHDHNQNNKCIDDINIGKTVGHHDHAHERDHHDHVHECDHHDHPNHADVHIHQNSSKPKQEHESVAITSGSSHSHFHEDHKHKGCHGDKESCNHNSDPNFSHISHHSHSCSSHSKESSSEGELPKEPRKHHHVDHNMEGIFLHVLADTMGSVGVVISTLLIKYKGWLVADPACSIFISVMIIASVIPLLRNSAEILLQRVPRSHEQDLKVALDDIMRIKGVCGVQNMHVWNFTNTNIVGTLHLHVSAETDKPSAKKSVSNILHEAGIEDITIQVECVKSY